MLLIFDIDGTICDTQAVEGRCYVEAVEEVAGVQLQDADWAQFEDPTSSGILREVLRGDPDVERKVEEVKRVFVEMLRIEQPKHPGDFRPVPQAVEFIQSVRERGHKVAIATGGFDLEAEFKLDCCGLRLHDFPHATSSDTPQRREILPLAIERASVGSVDVVYFGDAPWDVRVSEHLGIPMIGIGRRIGQLRALGLSNVFRDYSEPADIFAALEELAGV